MADMKMIMVGTGTWLLGYILIIVSQWIAVTLFPFLNDPTIGGSSTLEGILWIGLIIIWLVAILIAPLGIKIYGLQTETQDEKQLFSLAFSIAYAIFIWLFIYVAWDTINAMSAVMILDLAKVLYWVSVISIILFDGVGVPAYLIIEAKKGQ